MSCIAPALVIVLLGAACSATRGTVSSGQPLPPFRQMLSNGVAVVVEEHQQSDVAALQLWVRAGSRDEGPTELGLAHYLEHMLFKGTPTRPPGTILRTVEGNGGRMNAATSMDFTYYHITLPAAHVTDGIELLADMAVNASLDEGLLEAEKRVVLEEMRRGDDRPVAFLGRRLYGMAFEGHPYGSAVIGDAELIRALTRQTLVAFYRRHYVPENFTLVVVGAVKSEDVMQAAARTFGRLPRSGRSRLPVGAPGSLSPRRAEMPRPEAQAHLGLVWRAPPIGHADTPAVVMLATILGEGRLSRLTRTLREDLGLVSTISSSYAGLEAAGVLSVTARLEPDHLARVEDEILRELDRIRDRGVSEAERERAVTLAEARHEFRRETADGRAYALGRAETIWRIEDELAWLDRVRSVNAQQLSSVARRYLGPDRYVRLALVPTARSPR